MIKLLKNLKWSPDGVRIETIPSGEYQNGEIPDRAVEIARQLGIFEIIDDSGTGPAVEQQPEPEAKKGKK